MYSTNIAYFHSQKTCGVEEIFCRTVKIVVLCYFWNCHQKFSLKKTKVFKVGLRKSGSFFMTVIFWYDFKEYKIEI